MITYPLWSFSCIRWPSNWRNWSKAGEVCWLENSSSSLVCPYFWYSTPNLKCDTSTCSSYAAISWDALQLKTGDRLLTVNWSFSSYRKQITMTVIRIRDVCPVAYFRIFIFYFVSTIFDPPNFSYNIPSLHIYLTSFCCHPTRANDQTRIWKTCNVEHYLTCNVIV